MIVADYGPADGPTTIKPRLRRTEASAYLMQRHGVTLSSSTLAKLAVIGGGPTFQKDGRYPVYAITELDRYAAERLGEPMASTSAVRVA